jgi:hypothetical protein
MKFIEASGIKSSGDGSPVQDGPRMTRTLEKGAIEEEIDDPLIWINALPACGVAGSARQEVRIRESGEISDEWIT